MTSKKGFTLIEVLVVVGIVVILLAILVPVINKAIYQSELAACGADLKGMTTSFLMYANDNIRVYPQVTETRLGGPEWIAFSQIGLDASYRHDLRPLVEPYMVLSSFHCVLSPDISFEYADTGRPAPGTNVLVVSNYLIWAGWRLDAKESVMVRVGDRWSWQGTRFRVLAGDSDGAEDNGNGLASASHPDENGVMVGEAHQNSGGFTWSDWDSTPSLKRGTLDNNFAMDDGAVIRYNDVLLKDPRMKRVYEYYQVPQP